MVRPEPLHAHLAKTVSEGTGQKSLQKLLERIEEWKFGKEMALVLNRFNATRRLATADQKPMVRKIVEEQASRIYRLMRHVADGFEAAKSGGTGPEQIIIPILKGMITVNAHPGPTFNRDGEETMLGSLEAFTDDIGLTSCSPANPMST
ncbi:hypothetical protein [Bradyrhizobium sp. BR 1432]|uniref:hypothetical protein n=1 Tax=Bradyrhizobium sp. BR 1432 TaxID=3447966 RepID=UPI003EE774A8